MDGHSPANIRIPRLQQDSKEMGTLIEYVSAQVMLSIVLFYIGDVEQAMTFVPELSHLCSCLPSWCTYLEVHGLYWCGRIFALSADRNEALRCLRRARARKKYPFN